MACFRPTWWLSCRPCSILLALVVASSATAQSLTLGAAVRRAAETAPRLDAQTAAVTAAREDAARAAALPDPTLMVGIDNLPVTGRDAFDASVDDMTMKSIGIRQEFPARAKRDARRTMAERRVDEALADAGAERLRVQRAVAEAWIDAWSAGHELHALGVLRDQSALAAKMARARMGGGAGSPVDALAADAAVLEIDNQIEEARAMRGVASSQLARWLPGASANDVVGEPDFASLPASRVQLVARADELGPLLASHARIESAAAAVTLARAERRPDWSVTASYGQRARDRSDMLSIEFGVALPLFPRNRQDRGVMARQAEYEQALSVKEDERRALVADIDAAMARWEALKRQVALHEQRLLPLAEDRSAVALAAYRAGGELQPWLDARAAELEVHRAHARHLGELGRAWASLAFLIPEHTP